MEFFFEKKQEKWLRPMEKMILEVNGVNEVSGLTASKLTTILVEKLTELAKLAALRPRS